MSIEIAVIQAKNNQPIEYFGEKRTPEKFFLDCLHRDEDGWDFGNGDPEFWKFNNKLIVPGGRVLDLGTGFGRTSIPFALYGMRVTGYENDPTAAEVMRAISNAYDLPIEVMEDDVANVDFGMEQYDTVVLEHTFNHFPSKLAAFEVIEKAVRATKVDGHIWLRAGSKEDESFEELAGYVGYYPEVSRVDEDVFMAPCTCSGEYRIDPVLYFDSIELMALFVKQRTKIVYSRTIPEYDRGNFMYGEDWKPEITANKKNALVSILAQKR